VDASEPEVDSSLPQMFPHLKAKMQASILNVHKMFTYCK
jgi:hypothetical protein